LGRTGLKLEVIERRAARRREEAPPLLFVHGAWHGAWCWDEHFLPFFAGEGYDVYALSLRGHCGSSGRERLRWTRIEDYVADVANVAAGLRTAPVVIGHSMGGFVVQKYLEEHAAPAGVLLNSAPSRGVARATLRVACRQPLDFLKANLTLSLWPLIADPADARRALFSEGFPEQLLAKYHRLLQDESFMAYNGMLLLDLPKPEKVTAPMLVLGSENDAVFSQDEVKRTAADYRTTAAIFPGLAHDTMLELRWRDAAGHILDWLDERGL
jgi:pimeloyl-ACP methyl ester carboxylesterase